MNVEEMLRSYVSGKKETGLLLIGNGPLEEDALKVASSILCTKNPLNHPDFLMIGLEDGEKSIGVEKAEQICNKAALLPSVAPKNVVLIKNMDKMTIQAQNKLLKVIEEAKLCVVMATAKNDTLLPTIKSRMRVIYYTENAQNELPEGIASLVGSAILSGNGAALLGSLGFLAEKDKECFFLKHRDLVPALLSYIGRVLTAGLEDNPAFYEKIELTVKERVSCMSLSYSQQDLFLYLVKLGGM